MKQEVLFRIALLLTAEFASGNRTPPVGVPGPERRREARAGRRDAAEDPAGLPGGAVVLGMFVVYEIYRATQTGSVLLPFLAALDIAIIVLIIREYRSMRSAQKESAEHVDGPGDDQTDGHQRDE